MISGIFSNLLGRVGGWFLYIFIDPKADLPKNIMNKRKNQLNWLKRIDKLNPVYNLNQLIEIVRKGIIKRYSKEPSEILQTIYNTAINSGIGSVEVDNIMIEVNRDMSELADWKTYENKIVPAKEKSNFWKDVLDIVVFIGKLFTSIGSAFNGYQYTPSSYDWHNVGNYSRKESSAGAIIPIVAGGAIIYYLFTNTKKSNN